MNDSDRPTAEALVQAALDSRSRAYAPYSRFTVGAALLDKNGTVHTGANVEIASYGLTCCAERNAVFAAVARGARQFVAMAVASGPGASMCGACRQVLREFATDLVVHLADGKGTFRTTTLAALLPGSFGPEHLVRDDEAPGDD